MTMSVQPQFKIKLPTPPLLWMKSASKWFLGLAVSGACIYCLASYLQRRKPPPFIPRQRGRTVLRSPTSELQLQRRSTSPASTHGQTRNSANKAITDDPQQLGLMGVEALDAAVQYWEDALETFRSCHPNALPSAKEVSLCKKLERILTAAYALQDETEHLFLHEHSVIFQTEEARASTPTPSFRSKRTISTSSFASFYSAEGEDIEELFGSMVDEHEVPELYEKIANLMAEENKALTVPCRTFRTDMLECRSDADFLVKLHCIRLAFQNITNDMAKREWLTDAGRSLLRNLFTKLNRDHNDLIDAYESILRLPNEPERWRECIEEFKMRGIVCINFFDTVLDFVLLDSFEDLDSPPSAVLAVVRNRWLSDGFKESAVTTACLSVLKTKRHRLKYSNAFLARFYSLNEHLAPALAWGFLGTDKNLNKVCDEFKQDVIDVLCAIFDTHRVSYHSVESLELDIMRLFVAKINEMEERQAQMQVQWN